MLNMQKETTMSTAYTTPEPAAAEEVVLPTFNNGITPPNAPPPPVVEGIVPRAAIDPSVAPVASDQYTAPVEAVPGVGGIPGVQPD